MFYQRQRFVPPGLRGFPAALLALAFFSPGQAAEPAPELKPEQIYQRLLPSVMTLEVETRRGAKCVGAGFLALRENLAATAWHLVADARTVKARFADGTLVNASGVVDWDEEKDLALLHVEAVGRPLAVLASAPPAVGSTAFVIGAPRGFDFSLAGGLISQVRVLDGFRQYQVSCPISPGNSGGPIVNTRGEVLGIVAWSERDAQNLNFGTPASYLASLDASRPVAVWQALPKIRAANRRRQTAQVRRDAWRPAQASDGYAAMTSLLRKAGGQVVTVVVFQDGHERTFTFKVPVTAGD